MKTLTNLLAKDGTILLVTMNYDPESSPGEIIFHPIYVVPFDITIFFLGPPHYVLDDDVSKHFGKNAKIFNYNFQLI